MVCSVKKEARGNFYFIGKDSLAQNLKKERAEVEE
jgi:hypothetical protein